MGMVQRSASKSCAAPVLLLVRRLRHVLRWCGEEAVLSRSAQDQDVLPLSLLDRVYAHPNVHPILFHHVYYSLSPLTLGENVLAYVSPLHCPTRLV